MARAKRTPLERERDLALTEELHLRGRRPMEIADELRTRFGTQITPKQVTYDLNVLRKNYLKQGVRDFSLELQRQLRKLDLLERLAYEALEESRQELKTTTRKTRRKTTVDGEVTQSEIADRTEQRKQDMRCMTVIQWCIAERNRLLGLYPAEEARPPVTGTIREIIYEVPARMTDGGRTTAPGLQVIGGRALPPSEESDPTVNGKQHLDVEELRELWGADA